ncbi:hypothetical protein ACER0C_008953 [Sarotherodon galilaeus]
MDEDITRNIEKVSNCSTPQDLAEVASMIQQFVASMDSCEQEVDHTFEDLLVFVTGADFLPPLGFPQSCNTDFYDQESWMRRIPYASTCSLCLYLPRGVADEKQFMNTALKGSLGFGKA